MEFFLDIEPPRATAQEKKIRVVCGHPQLYDPPKLKEAKKILADSLMEFVPAEPIQSAVRLSVVWKYRTHSKKTDGTPKTTRPDTDNLDKALKDIMTKLRFWQDDAQVTSEHIYKRWSLKPGIEIRIEEDKI